MMKLTLEMNQLIFKVHFPCCKGSVNQKHEPSFTTDSTPISPPICVMMLLQIDNPIPVP